MGYNVDLMQEVRNLLAMYPERHVQAHFTNSLSGKLPTADANCGTSGCVAGWTLGLLGITLKGAYGDLNSSPSLIAGDALGLSRDEAEALFFDTLDSENPEQAALEMLDELIEKGKRQ